MLTIQGILQTLWASILALGFIKVIIIAIIIGLLSRMQPILGLVGAVLFVAYLIHLI